MAKAEQEAPPAAISPWDASTEDLLRDWHNRSAAAAVAHYAMAHRCRRRNVLLGVPVVVLSSVVGTSLFATLNEGSVEPPVRLGIGVISVAAAVLAALQTFLRFAERAERHVLAADWYTAVRRGIDEVLALPPETREPPQVELPKVRKEMSRIGQQAPEIPSPVWMKLTAAYHINDQPPMRPDRPRPPTPIAGP